MKRPQIILLAVLAVLVLAGAAVAGTMAFGGREEPQATAQQTTPPATEAAATGDLNTCAGLVQDEGRACYSKELAAIVNGAADPLAAVDAVVRFDCGHHPDRLIGWTTGRTPTDVARVLARAELIERAPLHHRKLAAGLAIGRPPVGAAGQRHVRRIAGEIEAVDGPADDLLFPVIVEIG